MFLCSCCWWFRCAGLAKRSVRVAPVTGRLSASGAVFGFPAVHFLGLKMHCGRRFRIRAVGTVYGALVAKECRTASNALALIEPRSPSAFLGALILFYCGRGAFCGRLCLTLDVGRVVVEPLPARISHKKAASSAGRHQPAPTECICNA